MSRRNSLPMTAEQVEEHNARVRAARQPIDVDAELRSFGVPMHLLPKPAAPAAKRPRMNKLESEWAMILEARKRAGEILWYQFEGLRLRLGEGAYFTPDFPVLNANGTLEFLECKGFWREAAKLRIRVAASLYPFWKFYAVRKIKKKDGGGWDIEGF